MKLTVRNLGPIAHAELDVRPLTVIIGRNNTGKTWLAYALHGLLRRTEHEVRVQDAIADLYPEREKPGCAEAIASILNDVNRDDFAGWTAAKATKGASVAIAMTAADLAPLDQTASRGQYAWARRAFGQVTVLPSDRLSLVTSFRHLIRQRAMLFRNVFSPAGRASTEQRRYLERAGDAFHQDAVEDFVDFLAGLDEYDFDELEERIEPLLRDRVLGGMAITVKELTLGGRSIVAKLGRGTAMPLAATSSSFKQLAALVLFLRSGRNAPGATLIIDEPELGLFPDAQAALLEILALVANSGVRVVMTTHSPFLLAHLNNLILGDPSDATRRNRQAKHLYTGDPDAFIAPEHVTAVELRDGTLHDLHDPDYGIRWTALGDVGAQLQEKWSLIHDEPARKARRA